MKPLTKAELIGAGYVAAFAIARAAVSIRIAATSGPERESAQGMYAFGDDLLFLAVFGAIALVPTGAALYLLRSNRRFWEVLSAAGLAVAATVVAALIANVLPSSAGAWSAFAVLRILFAPLLAPLFVVSALVTPHRGPRVALLAAAALEAGAFVAQVLFWRSHAA